MSYQDTQQKIQKTLTGRNSGTQITPDSHQNMAETMLNYIQEVENISVSSIEGIAYPDTEPLQPDAANVVYISAVPSNTTYTYKNFADKNGDAVSITATTDPLFVILFWNKKYWSYLATTSAPHLHVSAELTDSKDEVPSSKAVSDALQDIYKRSNPNDKDGNVVDTNTIFGITDNPQYVGVFTDLDGRFLGGFEKEDGNFVFVNKVPRDIQDAINAAVKQLQTADQTLKESIDAEGKARQTADQTLKESIDAEGKARQTADQTLKENIDAEIKDVYKKSNYNDDNNIIDFNTIHLITDNPEFVCVAVDANDKILYGIKTDGQPYFGVGCPQQVKDYIDKQINKILGTDDISSTIDSLKEIETFLKDFTNSDTLKKLLDLKANVDEVKATTDDIYKKSNPNDSEGNVVDTNTIISVEDNPEYIQALTDSMGKLIEAIGLDGIKKFFAGINIQGTLQCVTDNPEYIAAWLDNNGKIIFAIENDGNPYFGYGVPKQIKGFAEDLNTAISSKIDELMQALENAKIDVDKKIHLGDNTYPADVHKISENPEYISVILDASQKILEAYGVDGIKRLFTAIELMGTKMSVEDNSEFIKVEKDNAGKLLESTDFNGKKYIYGELVLHDILYGVISNIEYLSAILDKDNKILEGYTKDGVKKIYSPIEVLGIKKDITDNNEYESLDISKNGKIISGILKDGTNYFPLAKIDNLKLSEETVNLLLDRVVDRVVDRVAEKFIQPTYFNIKVWNPTDIYVLEGTTLQIFKNSLACLVNQDDYELRITNMVDIEESYKYGVNCDYCYEYIATSGLLTFGFTPALYCGCTKTISYGKPCTIHTISKAGSPSTIKNLICIGDSFTDQQIWVAELRRIITGETSFGSDSENSNIKSDNISNINFIGTRHTESGHTPNEGWSGQHYKFFAGYEGRGDIGESPFKNPETKEIDIDYFMSTGKVKGTIKDIVAGDKIDYAIIVLGTNGGYNEQYVTTIWDALLKHNPNIKVIVSGRCNATTHGVNSGSLYYRQTYTSLTSAVINCNSFFEDLAKRDKYKNNFLYVDYNISLDSIYNMPHKLVNPNIRNDEVKILRGQNNVHPSQKGYFQMADAFRGAFHYWFLTK